VSYEEAAMHEVASIDDYVRLMLEEARLRSAAPAST
jgi:hypothetical protein